MSTHDAPTADATTTTKKPTSAAQIAANQRNAKRSTGPRTDEGKSISRLNGLKHGGCAELPVLPGEDPGERQRRFEVWCKHLGAVTGPECFFVEIALDASLRVHRVKTVEAQALAGRMEQVETAHHVRLEEEFEILLDQFDQDPHEGLRALRQSSHGCRWMLDKWRSIGEGLEESGKLTTDALDEAIALLGWRAVDLFRQAEVFDWVASYLATVVVDDPVADADQVQAMVEAVRPVHMTGPEIRQFVSKLIAHIPTRPEGFANLKAVIANYVDDLTERVELIELREQRNLARAVEAARFDGTVEGERRSRYELSHQRSYVTALRELRVLQANRPDLRDLDPPVEDVSPPVLESPQAVAIPSQAAAVASAVPAPAPPKIVPSPAVEATVKAATVDVEAAYAWGVARAERFVREHPLVPRESRGPTLPLSGPDHGG